MTLCVCGSVVVCCVCSLWLLFCMCAAVQCAATWQISLFPFSRDKFLSLFLSSYFLSHPLLISPLFVFFLFLKKEIVLFLNDLTICQILELSIVWRWVEDKNSIRIKEYRGRRKKIIRRQKSFFLEPDRVFGSGQVWPEPITTRSSL